jgi:hypothetical protein
MSLITAHRILIGTAIGFFLFYAAFELRGYLNNGEGGALLRGGASLAAAAGWALYLRTVKPRRPGGGSP